MSLKTWFLNRAVNNKLNSFINSMKPGWKLKLTGLISAMSAVIGAAALLLDGNSATNPDWTAVIAAVSAGLGLLIARQNDVDSETAGAK